eukprot:2747805-Rhodomonas_salina.3
MLMRRLRLATRPMIRPDDTPTRLVRWKLQVETLVCRVTVTDTKYHVTDHSSSLRVLRLIVAAWGSTQRLS